ncbi:MAG: arsenate reductase ArsC [Rubrobacteridae bacterium]|nr:arsenate reductase ArsC [Rubrobacteridae bacterium]
MIPSPCATPVVAVILTYVAAKGNWARHLKSDRIEPHSAGIEAHGLNPLAVQAMKEAGVDISNQSSKLVLSIMDKSCDDVITVCGHADENCPVFPGKVKVVHHGFDDPAKASGTEEEKLAVFRRVRDEIRAFIETLPEALL